MYNKEILPNGVRVVTRDIKGRDSISIGIWVGVGGRFEEDRLKGAAHFLEHILFKGSKNYSCEQIKTLIEGVGGTLNAFTSEEQTCFYAKIPSKHLRQTFEVLADMVTSPKIAERDVAKEKTVILEEIKMYHDLPQYFVLELLDGLMWPGHPLGKSLAGTVETVTEMSGADLRKFHRTHYVPQNVVVAACGNLTHNKIVGLVREKFGGLQKDSGTEYLKFAGRQLQPQVNFHKKDIEQMHLALGMHGYDQWHDDRYTLNLLSVILGGNMSSRLFVEIREKRGLAYSISCSLKALQDTGLFLIRAGVDNRKVVEAVALILEELKKITRRGVSQDEFDRGREYLLGQLLLGLEDTMENMLWLGEGMIAKNKIKTLEEVVRAFARIKKADVQRVAKEILDDKRYNLALVGPVTATQEKQLRQLMGM
ncbi:MAG TPA: pitrilysin family protein [Candidatus Omnitrophota bacterium]|nr:pitrilysin family protein [Candidatus Omnitrophota bacterium]